MANLRFKGPKNWTGNYTTKDMNFFKEMYEKEEKLTVASQMKPPMRRDEPIWDLKPYPKSAKLKKAMHGTGHLTSKDNPLSAGSSSPSREPKAPMLSRPGTSASSSSHKLMIPKFRSAGSTVVTQARTGSSRSRLRSSGSSRSKLSSSRSQRSFAESVSTELLDELQSRKVGGRYVTPLDIGAEFLLLF